jgi:hypothetical protein
LSSLTPRPRLTANEQCHCGSGKKYKYCCRDKDEAEARDARMARQQRGESQRSQHDHPGGLCQFYRASNRGISAVNRRDFKWLTTRMSVEGATILHVQDPRDLGSRPEHLRAAVEHLEQAHIQADFGCDPAIEFLTATQHTLDVLSGAGAYRVRGSGHLWGRAGRGAWRIDRDGTPTAYCDRENPLGFALLGARCRDMVAEGYQLPLPLLRVIAGANLLDEIGQAAAQIDDIFANDVPDRAEGGALTAARAVYQRIVALDGAMPDAPNGAVEHEPAGLLSCALAFAGGFTAPEAALTAYPLSDEARVEYVRALHNAQDSAPVREIIDWIGDLELPPDRVTALEMLAMLSDRQHPLAERADNDDDRAAVGIGVPSIKEVREVAIVERIRELHADELASEAPMADEAGLAAAHIIVSSPESAAAAKLDALLADRGVHDALNVINQRDPGIDAERSAAQQRLDAAEDEVLGIDAELEQLRAQLRQLQRRCRGRPVAAYPGAGAL